MDAKALRKLADEQAGGYPMPTEDRINAALWEIAAQLAELNEREEFKIMRGAVQP